MDLAYASDLVTDAMASLNIEANKQNVDEFGNKLAMAASRANANVAQLGEAILTVGGTAANLKGGTTELTTALGLLANVGIKGAEGGTHLRNIILSLQSPTKDAREVMEQLGLEVYDTQGNMRQLDDILTDLNTVMDGMTQGDKDGIINALFNKTDLAAVNGLLAAQGEQWETLATQIDNAGDAMGQMADTQLDNLQGAVTIMQSALEGLQLAIYDKMEPALKVLTQGATETISTLTTILSQDGPAAMLDAAVTIIGSLVNGITQKIPMVMSAATGIIIKLTQYLGDHADDLFDAGIKILENLIVGIQNNLPALITAAAQLLAKFAAALISHLPDLLKCGASLLQAIVEGILLGIANLGEAAIACVAKIVGVWDGNYTEWGNIGTNIVLGIKNGIIGAWDGLVSGVKSKVAGMVDSVKNLLGIHSPSKVFDEIGMNICKGLAQGLTTDEKLAKDAAAQVVASVTNTATTLADGIETVTQSVTETLKDGTTQQKQTITATGTEIIDGVERTVKTVTTIAADGTQTVAKTIEDAGPQYGSMGELLTEQFRTKLDEGWAQIQADIQTDALGAIETLATALKDGDLEQLGLWAASYFWQACTKEQQAQIQSVAMGALNQLGSALGGVFGNLANLAMGLVAQFVPAAASATAGQTALNVAMDANPILFVISLIGMLVGALLNFSGKNKDVANAFQNVWAGVEDFMSYIFEGLMRIVAAGIEGFVILINGLIGLYNSVAWLYGGTIDYISNPAWDYANKIAADRKARQEARKKQQEAINNPSSSGTSTNSQKVIESMTDTSKTTRADGSTVTTKVLTEKLQDETGKITQRVTKTVTEAGTKLVDGVERSYKTVTTYVDGVQTKLERSLDDIAKTTTGTKPGSTTPTAPTPDKDLTDAVEANTEALLAANSKLAEMVRQANSLVLSDNMAISRSVAASGTAQVAAAANNYHREGDTNIIQNIYSKAQTAADLQREARWEADRAKAQKR